MPEDHVASGAMQIVMTCAATRAILTSGPSCGQGPCLSPWLYCKQGPYFHGGNMTAWCLYHHLGPCWSPESCWGWSHTNLRSLHWGHGNITGLKLLLLAMSGSVVLPQLGSVLMSVDCYHRHPCKPCIKPWVEIQGPHQVNPAPHWPGESHPSLTRELIPSLNDPGIMDPVTTAPEIRSCP